VREDRGRQREGEIYVDVERQGGREEKEKGRKHRREGGRKEK
jgi:hypothetical protein